MYLLRRFRFLNHAQLVLDADNVRDNERTATTGIA